MENDHDAPAADDSACAETAKFLRDKDAFEAESAAGFAEAERLLAQCIADHEARQTAGQKAHQARHGVRK